MRENHVTVERVGSPLPRSTGMPDMPADHSDIIITAKGWGDPGRTREPGKIVSCWHRLATYKQSRVSYRANEDVYHERSEIDRVEAYCVCLR